MRERFVFRINDCWYLDLLDCPIRKVPTPSGCAISVNLGDKCNENDKTCSHAYAQCLHRQCQCIAGAQQHGDACVPGVEAKR